MSWYHKVYSNETDKVSSNHMKPANYYDLVIMLRKAMLSLGPDPLRFLFVLAGVAYAPHRNGIANKSRFHESGAVSCLTKIHVEAQ